MVAFTFVCKKDGDSWAATRLDSEEGDAMTAEADDTYRCCQDKKCICSLALPGPTGAARREVCDLYTSYEMHMCKCCVACRGSCTSWPSSRPQGAVRTSFSTVSPTSAVYQVGLWLAW